MTAMDDRKRSEKFVAASPKDLAPVARALIERFSDRTIVLLSGPLGVGKTKLVETIVREMSGVAPGSATDVASPTFSLYQVYQVGAGKRIHHFDLYRIDGEDELETVGLWDVLSAEIGLVLIEWPEKLRTASAQLHEPGWRTIHVRFEQLASGAREISLNSSY